MRYHYDLHIHSVLSGCADLLMTPNNIINMANLKGLSIISITDHNSLKQLPIVDEVIQSYDMVLVYGVEVSIEDESHVLCYFKTIEDALSFDKQIRPYIVEKPVNLSMYNQQVITDIEDLEKEVIPYFLGGGLSLDMSTLINILETYDHLRFLAHVDRDRNSGYHYINQYFFHGVELSKNAKEDFIKEIKSKNLFVLYNSDAHQLTEINEVQSTNSIELDELSIHAFFKAVRNG